VYYAELDISELLLSVLPDPKYRTLPKYPAVERDFCLVMDREVESGVVAQTIGSASDLVESVEPFDVYQGEKLGARKKSVTYSVQLRAKDRTLTDKEAEKAAGAILTAVKKTHKAELRR
jgi:phenylalanyl-tRNA synthetase beta chain